MRAFAFASVFIHHAMGAPLLWFGVDLFFVISGFLITGILLRQRDKPHYFRVFYYRRALRIFPPYYLILALVFVFWQREAIADWAWYVFYGSNYQMAFVERGSPHLTAMWSLAVEEQFYLIWPLVVYWLSTRNLTRLCLALLVLAPIVRLVLSHVTGRWEAAYTPLPCRVDLLAAGALLAVARRQAPDRFTELAARGLLLSALSAVPFVALIALAPGFRTTANSMLFNTVGYTLIAGMMTGAVAWIVVLRQGMVFRLLCQRTVVYLGTISYMLYLAHQPILHELRALGMAKYPAAAAGLIAAIGFATLTWFVLEKPLQRYKDRVSAYGSR